MPTTNCEAPAGATVRLVPKNRGLTAQVARLRGSVPGVIDYTVRGEDIPFLANELSRSGRRVIAYTGDDLLDEWLLAGNALDQSLGRRRVAWHDPSALYGAPALCLLGTSAELLDARRPVRVAVCDRYRRLTARFLDALSVGGGEFETMVIAGSLENCLRSGIADLAVDIVVTGSTIESAGLRVLRVISTSDVAVLETRY